MERNDRTKKSSFKLPSVANYGKVSTWVGGGGLGREVYLQIPQRRLWPDNSLSPEKGWMDRSILSLPLSPKAF